MQQIPRPLIAAGSVAASCTAFGWRRREVWRAWVSSSKTVASDWKRKRGSARQGSLQVSQRILRPTDDTGTPTRETARATDQAFQGWRQAQQKRLRRNNGLLLSQRTGAHGSAWSHFLPELE